jgi:hypothetical protein
MEPTEIREQAEVRIARWSILAAKLGAISLLLSLILHHYQVFYLERHGDRPFDLNYPFVVSTLYISTPLLVVILYRRFIAITSIYALISLFIVAGRTYYPIKYYFVGPTALVRPFDWPAAFLIALGVPSVALVLIWIVWRLTIRVFDVHRRSKPSTHGSLPLVRVCVCLLLLMLPACAPTRFPFAVPFRFGSDRVIEFPVDLTRHRFYQIDLVFPFRNQEEREVAKRLAGEPTRLCKPDVDCGVIPSFLITIKRGTDVLLREESAPGGTYAFGGTGFNRAILKTALQPGQYIITVEITYVPTELINRDASIEFTTHPNSSDLEN